MKLKIDQIREITSGAASIVFQDGLYHFFRFNSRETAVIDNPNVVSQAGIQMRFKTDASCLRLKIHTIPLTQIRSYFSFDVFVNGVFAGSIQNTGDDDCTGDYANKVYPLGKYQSEFTLGNAESCIRLVFPHSVKVCVEEIELVDATYVVPIRKQKTVLYYGDSITQGYDALHPSESYAVRLAEALDADVINKALGGAVFDPELVKIPCDKKADYVVVAYGTNDWNSVDLDSFRNNAEGFLRGIEKNYSDIPVLIVTPIWRTDWKETKRCGEFPVIEKTIREIFENRKNITVISGFDLIPHSENLFGDLWVHPSGKGFEYYAENLKNTLLGGKENESSVL